MKRFILPSVLGALLALTTHTASSADPPYIDDAYVGGAYGSSFHSNGEDYINYTITVVLDYPQPYVDDIDWYAVDSPYTIESGTVSWPSPSGDPLLDEDWDVYEHILELKATKIDDSNPAPDNEDVDNSYYFTYDGDESYSYVCHGCAQAGGNGAVYIYNP